ncbi:MAG: hypothetical protein EOM05_11395 [Clostridia bacterium]|nr:hypothetical protein [Clostridia bacterium]NCC88445.1 hypothetical protein [Clostridia bacterium]
MIIYAVEYFDIKTITLENYYLDAVEINKKLSALDFLAFNEPMDLVKNYIQERSSNTTIKNILENFPGGVRVEAGEHLVPQDTAKHALKQYIMEHEKDAINAIGVENVEEFVEDSINVRYEKYVREINAIMEQYIEISKTNYKKVENAYGNIYFFATDLKKRRCERVMNIYSKLHQPQRDTLNKIKSSAYHFEKYIKSQKNNMLNNLPVVIVYILELQDMLFRTEVRDEHHVVYKEYYNNMENELEIFRASIYRDDPVTKENKPFLFYLVAK